jgi:hypothetical protein
MVGRPATSRRLVSGHGALQSVRYLRSRYCALSAQCAALVVERSYTDRGGDLAPVRLANSGKSQKQGFAQYRTDAGHF